jgi:hypothetical protein
MLKSTALLLADLKEVKNICLQQHNCLQEILGVIRLTHHELQTLNRLISGSTDHPPTSSQLAIDQSSRLLELQNRLDSFAGSLVGGS